jgi:uncharacterized protein YjbI with pentapeptide repeats
VWNPLAYTGFMPNAAHLAALAQGPEAWNAWREAHPEIVPDFSNADLRGFRLFGARLDGANLTRANLIEATLSLADLSGADLTEATLLDARLVQCKLIRARLRGAVLARARIVDADLTEADLEGADLSYVSLSRVVLNGAKLSQSLVYGIGAWDVTTNAATEQKGLVVTPPETSRATVDDIEVAQLIHLLLTHAKLRNVINAVTRNGVLLLGRFGNGGLALLQALAERLRAAGYLPMLFDFERPDSRNYTETVMTLAGLSRIVVAELSGPSVPQELHATVPHFKIPFVPLLQKGTRPYAMFPDLLEYPWVIKPVVYDGLADLLESVPARILAPAEARYTARQALLDQLFDH